MKLFQKMLVAGTALSLIAPVASQATETVNLEEMNSYVRSEKTSSRIDSETFVNDVKDGLAKINSRVDGLEAKQNNFEAGAFSDTTTMDGKAIFTVGAIDADDSLTALTESTIFQYSYTMNLNTSFTGDDNLYVRIKTGNGHKTSSSQKDKVFNETATGTYLSSASQNGDALKIDKMWYTMPIGEKFTFTAGPKIENYYMHGTTPSIYKPVLKQFTLGGNASAYGASTSPGAGLTWTGDSGLAFSTNFTSQKGNESGLFTDEVKTSWATQIGYTQPQYSISAILNQKYNDWEDSYFSTSNGKDRTYNDKGSTNIGLRGWWRPQETGTATPSVSVGFDTSETDASSNSNTNMYFVGLQWQDIFQADDRIGLAFGQPQKREDETTDPFAWEAYYQFQVNDSLSITPAVFGASDRNGSAGADLTGAVIETTFKF
jgi:hypothetical protein